MYAYKLYTYFSHVFWIHFPFLKMYIVLFKLCCMHEVAFLVVHYVVFDKDGMDFPIRLHVR
jgi:hypothetical protein